MLCPVCMIERMLEEDIESIKEEGYCTRCAEMDEFFEDDRGNGRVGQECLA